MSALEQAKAELESASAAPLVKSDAATPETPLTPVELLAKAMEALTKALGTSGHKNAPSSESMPGQTDQAMAMKGDAKKRDHAIDQARVSNKEAVGDSPMGAHDTRFPEQPLEDGRIPEEDMSEYLPGEDPDQSKFRGTAPSTKGPMHKSMKKDSDGDYDGDEDYPPENEDDPDDGEGEAEEEADEAPARPPRMTKSQQKSGTTLSTTATTTTAPRTPALGAPADEDTIFKSVVMNDTAGTYTSVVEASDALTYLTDELVKSQAAQGRILAENDQKIIDLLAKSHAAQTKKIAGLQAENTRLTEASAEHATVLGELSNAVVALMKSGVALHETLSKGFTPAPVAADVAETPGLPQLPAMPPRLVSQAMYGQYVNPASFASRTEQDGANAAHAEQLAKSQAALTAGQNPAEQPLNKSMVMTKLERGVREGLVNPEFLSRLDQIGPGATIAQLPLDVRAKLGF